MMGAYPRPQIFLLERFQTHRQFVNKAQVEDSFTSQLTADAVADVKEDLGTFRMSALTEEQTYDDYHELINITYISWHYSSLRHTICGTCKVDVKDDIHIASHCALLCKHSNWSPYTNSAFSVSGPMAWNGLPVALRLTPVGHVALFLSGLKTKLLDRSWAGSAILKGLHIKLL